MKEKAIRLNPFFRCECGKIHTRAFISVTSVCKCGRKLWNQAWGFVKDSNGRYINGRA